MTSVRVLPQACSDDGHKQDRLSLQWDCVALSRRGHDGTEETLTSRPVVDPKTPPELQFAPPIRPRAQFTLRQSYFGGTLMQRRTSLLWLVLVVCLLAALTAHRLQKV